MLHIMCSVKYAAAILLARAALAMPTARATTSTSEPAVFTANPSIGQGGSIYTDSAHFRIYGSSGSSVNDALQMLEGAYTCFVTDLGWRSSGLSYRSNSGTRNVWYKENVYSVGSLSGGAAGVMRSDYIAGLSWLEVVNRFLADPQVTVHEYGHALTYHARNWVDQTATGAWWETVANWVADTYITSDLCERGRSRYNQKRGNTLIDLQKVIGDSFQVIVDGSRNTGNYYQAWPLLTYLTNNPDNYTGLGRGTMWDLFDQYAIGSNETPLHTLARILSSSASSASTTTTPSTTVAEVIGRYWARMAYVDIGHALAQHAFLDQRKNLQYDNLDSQGGKYTVKPGRRPCYMGANINPLQLSDGDGGRVTVRVQSSGEFTATLAVRNINTNSIRYVDLNNGSGVAIVRSNEEVSLVVANTPSTLYQYNSFSLSDKVTTGLIYSVEITGATIATQIKSPDMSWIRWLWGW